MGRDSAFARCRFYPTCGWVIATCLLVLANCTGQGDGTRPAAPEPSPAAVDPPAPQSGVPRLGGVKWTVRLPSPAIATPLQAEGVLYVMTSDGRLRAIDAETAAERWTRKVSVEGFGISPILSGSLVLAADRNTVRALDAQTGTEEWRFAVAGTLTSQPTLAEGVLYVPGSAGHLQAINSQTGDEQWSVDADIDPFSGGFGEKKSLYELEGPAAASGSAYFWSGAPPDLYAVDVETRKRRWKHALGRDVRTLWTPTAVAMGNDVYVLTLSHLLALDARTGQVRWTAAGGLGEVVRSGGSVYFGTFGGQVQAVDARTGHEIWSTQVGAGTSTPTVRDGVVYATGGTDKPVAGSVLPAPGESPPPVGGWVAAIDAQTGRLLWKHEVEAEPIRFSACVGPSAVYVVTKAGMLLALQ